MNCQEAQDLLHAYLDGELDVIKDVAMTQHLQVCQACAQAYNAQHQLRSALHTHTLTFSPPAHLQQRIRSAVRQASAAGLPPRAWSWRWLGVGVAAAAVGLILWRLVLVGSGLTTEDLLTQEILSGHVRSLMAQHLTDVTSSDQHTVKPWFDGKLAFSPPVKDLAGSGFPLVGGRLDYLDRQPVAALVYQRRQHVINVFSWPSAHDTAARAQRLTRQGYTLMHWVSGGMVYWAVSNLNPHEFQEFVHLMQSQAAMPSSPSEHRPAGQ